MVHSESQENGQKEAKRSKYEEDDELQADEASKEPEEKMDTSSPGAMETKFPSDSSLQTNAGNGSQGKFGLNTALGWLVITLFGGFLYFFFSPFCTVATSEALIRRSISQQRTGVSITIDDPVRTARQPSPPRGKVSCIVHISNLVGTSSTIHSDSHVYTQTAEFCSKITTVFVAMTDLVPGGFALNV